MRMGINETWHSNQPSGIHNFLGIAGYISYGTYALAFDPYRPSIRLVYSIDYGCIFDQDIEFIYHCIAIRCFKYV